MAFTVASKQGAPMAGLLNNVRRLAATSSSSLLSPASVAATRRLYSTGGVPLHYHQPWSIGHDLVQYHYLAACHFFHYPIFFTPAMFFTPAAPMWSWVSKQDEKAVEVTVAMPGLPKERVKIWTNKKGLFVSLKGEGVKGPDDAAVKDPPPCSCHIELSADAFELDKAKAEMKDGLLKVTVPRVVKWTEIKIE